MSHAPCSPSGAYRWMTCPGSIREEQKYPEQTSKHAALGTRLHEAAEEALLANDSSYVIDASLTPEQIEIVSRYAEYVMDIPGYRFYEHRMGFNKDCWGTSDSIVVDNSTNTLHVIDLKTGSGIKVFAENNLQLMIYALMALEEFEFLHQIDEVQIHVVQPSLDHFDVWTISPRVLKDWEPTLSAAIELTQDPTAKLNPSEEACQFCRARFQCSARAKQAVALGAEAFALIEPNQLSLEQIAKVLTHKKELSRWLDDAETYALELALNGTTIPGFELGQGRSTRRYIDGDAVAQKVIASGVEEPLIYERNLIPLTAMEKLLGKKKFSELLSDQITRQPGKTVLVPSKEPRPSLRSAVEALADFS